MALPLALCALAFPVWGLSLTEWWRFSHIGVSLGLVVGGFLLPLAERISVAVPVGGSFLVGGLVSAGILHWQLRRHAGKFAIICITLTALVSAPGAEAPLVLDSRKQLFLDDYLISSMTNVRRTVEQAQKFPGNPVLSRTASWESPLAIIYGSVIRDGKEFKMWYLSRNQSGYGVSYATSEDGIRWNKPRLDLTLVDGERSNVLFNKQTIWTGAEGLPYFQELFGVQRDDREPDPARRYKMGVLDIDWKYDGPDGLPGHKGQRRGLGVAGSPDGIHWKLIESWASTAILDGGTHWMFDPARDKYVLYGRTTKELPEVKAAWSTNEGFQTWYAGRAVARLESADFVKWDFTRPLTAPVVMTADLQDPPITEIYSLKVFPYEGIYIGLVQVLHSAPEAGTLDVQLAVSRDSILFTRAGDRGTFIPLGPAGSWDRFNLSVANNDPIVAGDELRFYYSGRLYRHAPYSGPDKGVDRSSIGFATIKRDRFVALEASFDGGEIVTQPVKLKGPTLHLNAKCDFGEIVVEMLEAGGKVLGRSTPIQRDELDIPLKWSSEVEPPGGPVTLRIKLKNARLFALWCGQ
jgi:hypothetical protein